MALKNLDKLAPTLLEKAYKKAYSVLKNQEDAKDIASDVCEEIIKALNTGTTIRNPVGYVKIAAENRAINLLKRRERECELKEEIVSSPALEKSIDLGNKSLAIINDPNLAEVQQRLNLKLTERESEAFEIYLFNIQRSGKALYRQIGKEMGVREKRAHELVEHARNKLFKRLFWADILQGEINYEIIEVLTRDWRDNPLRNMMAQIANNDPTDELLLGIQDKGDEFFHQGITSLEAMVGNENKVDPKEFFKGYNCLFAAALPCWRITQETIIDFGEEYILKNPRIPWILKQVAFRANNLAGSIDFQALYKEYLLDLISRPSSKEAILTALYIMHYFDEFDFDSKTHFIENSLLDPPSVPRVIPVRTVSETRANIQEEWYRSKTVLMEVNFLRCYLVCLVTESFGQLRDIKKSYHSLYQITRNILKFSTDNRIIRLAKYLADSLGKP